MHDFCFKLLSVGEKTTIHTNNVDNVLQTLHENLSANWIIGIPGVANYGNVLSEHLAFRQSVAVIDLSFRSRWCVLGNDRIRFLNGQVTNDINRLEIGQGCYAALVTAKGKMVSDMNVFRLPNELLLDFEPNLGEKVSHRLQQYIIADDVELTDASPHFGLFSVQGPVSDAVAKKLGMEVALPNRELSISEFHHPTFGEVYVGRHARLGTVGFDIYIPVDSLETVGLALTKALTEIGGTWSGWQAFDMARIEAGIPRFGIDMDETNLAPETGIESRAISYSKGCYIGQEIIARIRTYGQVTKSLRGLYFSDGGTCDPKAGDKLFHNDKEVGYVTSAVHSLTFQKTIGLGYVRREAMNSSNSFVVRNSQGETETRIAALPFSEKFA